MTDSWRVSGSDLDTATVKVIVEPLTMKADQAVRVQQVARLHALARKHVVGRDLPVYAFRFRFIGPATARATRLHTVRASLRVATWTLQAPDAPNELYFNAASKTISLTTLGIGIVYGEGVGAVALDVVALEPAPDDTEGGANDITGQVIPIDGGCVEFPVEVLLFDQGTAMTLLDDFEGLTEVLLLGESDTLEESASDGISEEHVITNT